jgi:hypothetical protein
MSFRTAGAKRRTERNPPPTKRSSPTSQGILLRAPPLPHTHPPPRFRRFGMTAPPGAGASGLVIPNRRSEAEDGEESPAYAIISNVSGDSSPCSTAPTRPSTPAVWPDRNDSTTRHACFGACHSEPQERSGGRRGIPRLRSVSNVGRGFLSVLHRSHTPSRPRGFAVSE